MIQLFKLQKQNIPNLLSISRLVLLPILAYLAYINEPFIFGILLTIYASTDSLDGYLARRFQCTSDFGAKLDSLADDIGSIFLILFAYLLFPFLFTDYGIYVYLVISLFIISQLLRTLMLKNIGLHFYSGKATMAAFLILVISISFFGFIPILFYSWFVISLIHFTEVIPSIIFLKPTSDTKTILDLINLKK